MILLKKNPLLYFICDVHVIACHLDVLQNGLKCFLE